MAEEIEQLDHQSDTPPVMLQFPYMEVSHDFSSTRVTSDELPCDTSSTGWSPSVGQSPLMSPSTNSGQLIINTSSSSLESPESPVLMARQGSYRSHDSKKRAVTVGSHEQHGPLRSRESGLHDQRHGQNRESPDQRHSQNRELHDQRHGQNRESLDQRHGHNRESSDQLKGSRDHPAAYDAYVKDSFSCPNLSTLECYGESQHLQHFSADGQSAIWEERFHDNFASVTNIHLESGTAHDYHSNNYYTSNICATPNTLSPVVEEPSPSVNPPSHVYKVMICMASLVSLFILLLA